VNHTIPNLPRHAPQPADPALSPGRSLLGRAWSRGHGYLASAATVAVCTAIAWPLSQWLPPTNLVMIYLAGVVLAGGRFGRGPSIIAAIGGVLAFDFYFTLPRYSLRVNDPHDVITFLVMLTVGLVISSLTASLREREREAASRAERMTALYELTRDLSQASTVEAILSAASARMSRPFGAVSASLIERSEGNWRATCGGSRRPADAAIHIDAVERWWRTRDLATASPIDLFVSEGSIYRPLGSASDSAVLVLEPWDRAALDVTSHRQLLSTFARQIAGALEREHLAERARAASLAAQDERVRSSLLSSLSHDLRTPLAVIESAASSVIDTADPALDPEVRERIAIVRDEARHVRRVVTNILEMTRLESAAIELNRDWYPVDELVSSALARARSHLAAHLVSVDLPTNLPMIHVDGVLFESLLRNLLENAGKYTPPGAHVVISVTTRDAVEGRSMDLRVSDDGPGLPPGLEERLFEKFVRGKAESAVPGVGLGLSICRAIADVHGATISASNRPTGGADFLVSLPLSGTPPPGPGAGDT
jgi:two-component system, OmpR family, sensor histidine kinase KdpD